jgi:hypothetical protein
MRRPSPRSSAVNQSEMALLLPAESGEQTDGERSACSKVFGGTQPPRPIGGHCGRGCRWHELYFAPHEKVEIQSDPDAEPCSIGSAKFPYPQSGVAICT